MRPSLRDRILSRMLMAVTYMANGRQAPPAGEGGYGCTFVLVINPTACPSALRNSLVVM